MHKDFEQISQLVDFFHKKSNNKKKPSIYPKEKALFLFCYKQFNFCYNKKMYYYEEYVGKLKEWLWPQPPIEGPLETLRKQLQQSQINFVTKHSGSSIVIERICMMYMTMIAEAAFSQFRSTLAPPLQFSSEEKIPNIFGRIKVEQKKVKFELLVILVINHDIEETMPSVYVRNTEPLKMEPNPKYSQVYELVMGGLKIRASYLRQKMNMKWEQYSKQNLLILMKCCEETVRTFFPYMKRTNSTFYNTSDLLPISTNIQKCLSSPTLLPDIQHLTILKESLSSEINHINSENSILVDKLNVGTDDQLMPEVKNGISSQVLECICQERALKDCWEFVEGQFGKKNTQLQYSECSQMLKKMAEQMFEIRYKISLLTQDE